MLPRASALNSKRAREKQLPRAGTTVSFDQLVNVLDSVNASARLVSDPMPFLATQRMRTDRWVGLMFSSGAAVSSCIIRYMV
jgi:hypothetical protein